MDNDLLILLGAGDIGSTAVALSDAGEIKSGGAT
jgi:hypothetical protein